MSPDDWMFPQYREQAAIMWRGFSIEQMANQLCSNYLDYGKAR